MRQFKILNGNTQRLDGGAMFGHVPKALWSQWIQPAEDNTILLNCRCLLIQEPERNILLETGVGAFFDPKLRERYGVQSDEHALLTDLAALGLTDVDIDIVILSHLHFDHAGGLLATWQADQAAPQLLFPQATFMVSAQAWARAESPHLRDKASFIPGLTDQLKASGRLVTSESEQLALLGPDYQFHYSHGHTPGMLHTQVQTARGPLCFAADLIPGTPWVHLPITMGYDRAPEQLIDEKACLLTELVAQQGMLFYTHDAETAVSSVFQDEKGRFQAVACANDMSDLSILSGPKSQNCEY